MFSAQNLQINRGSTSANTQGGSLVTVAHTYKDLSLTVAAITLLFPPNLGQGVTQEVIFVGDHIIIEGSDTTTYNRILALDPFTVGTDYFSGASGMSIAAPIPAVDVNAATLTGNIFQMEIADQTHPGIVTEVAQDFGGEKTFRADMKIIPDNDFVVAPPAIGGLLIKTQEPIGGMQIQTDGATNIMAYSFGTVGLGANYAGLVFSETAFGTPFAPGLFLALGSTPALGIDSAGNATVSLILHVDTINERTLAAGTTINGNAIKSNQITMTNNNIFWDTDILVGLTRLSFDMDDFISYDKLANAFIFNINNLPVFQVDAISGIKSDPGFDRLTPGALLIGAATATSITLQQDTTIAAGKKLILGTANTFFDNATVNPQEIMWHFAGTSPTDDFVYYDTGTRAFSFAVNSSDVFTATATAFYVFPPLILSNGVDSDVAIPLLIGDNNATAIALNAPATIINSATVDFVAASVTNFMQGNSNIVIGTNAGDSITSGVGCVAIGDNALTANTTASDNIALGSNALAANTTATGNIAIGSNALKGCTTASANNVAIGASALSSNSLTGGSHVAIGGSALVQNTTGSFNVAVGFLALNGNTTGDSNTACGEAAMVANSTGINNAVLGAGALGGNTTGNQNSGVGRQVLNGVTTGSDNTAIGHRAARFVTTGSGNTALGSGAGGGLTGADNNNIDISHPGVIGDVGIVRIGTAGTHVKSFQAGIRGITTDAADAIAVLISSTGQLGTASSLREKKENIHEISATENAAIISMLQPVRFDYIAGHGKHQQFGLIADDVEKIYPDICAYDADDKLQTVYYDRLPIMLLREVQRLQTEIELLKSK